MKQGHLAGSLRTVRLTSLLLKNGIKIFSVERGGEGFMVEKQTLMAKIMRKPFPDAANLLAERDLDLSDRNLRDSIRISLIHAFDMNPLAKRIEVDASRMSWRVQS